MKIIVTTTNGESVQVDIDQHPDSCPICHMGGRPECIFQSGIYLSDVKLPNTRPYKHYVEVAYKCPIHKCGRMFVGRFGSIASGHPHSVQFHLIESAPIVFRSDDFPEEVAKLSPDFCEIYNQAAHAETMGLGLVAGPGYRKALEYLVKDMLKQQSRDDSEDIKRIEECKLGKLIETIDDSRLRESAKRAAWLGNDETHYNRKWKEHDINDCKKLIKMVVNWVDNVIMSENYRVRMPGKDT